MKRLASFVILLLGLSAAVNAQYAPVPIEANRIAEYNAAFEEGVPDSIRIKLPWSTDLGVRRVIVADANGDGKRDEIIATDYNGGGRVHVLKLSQAGDKLEVIWSSQYGTGASGSTPRFPRVGDTDGDGIPEIIFCRNSTQSIDIYEWKDDTQLWGTEPDFQIDTAKFRLAGARGTLRLNREYLAVYDFDGDGKDEIISHAFSPAGADVYIIGIDGDIPGFASMYFEGGHPSIHDNGADIGAVPSYWSSHAADLDGDGRIEIVNHHWDKYGMWSIQPLGPDSYYYPESTHPEIANAYHQYTVADAVNYFGCAVADVDGDGKDEIFGTPYTDNFHLRIHSFTAADSTVYKWRDDSASVANCYRILYTKEEMAAVGGKTTSDFWPIVKGDLNNDGKDELYTGGGRGLNVIAIQYKGEGSLFEKENYDMNLVYDGEGGGVYATYNVYHGKTDSTITDGDTIKTEVPFTSYIFAENVDLNDNGYPEIVVSQQSVYDSVTVKHYYWVDSISQFVLNSPETHKIFNPYRKNIILLEWDGVGFTERRVDIVTPNDYALEQNFPNPFNPSTTINFSLPVDKKISLKVFDMLGREVRTLINDELFKQGSYQSVWDGKNNNGMNVSSGHYIARLTYGAFSKTIKMTLLK